MEFTEDKESLNHHCTSAILRRFKPGIILMSLFTQYYSFNIPLPWKRTTLRSCFSLNVVANQITCESRHVVSQYKDLHVNAAFSSEA